MDEKNFPLRGDIYWADLNPVKGSEQEGQRPVLVISNNLMNKNSPVILAIPMTRNGETKKVGPFNIKCPSSHYAVLDGVVEALKSEGHRLVHTDSVIMCNQLRALNKTRLKHKIGFLKTPYVLGAIKTSLLDSFGLSACQDCGYPTRPTATTCGYCNKIVRKKCGKCDNVLDLSYKFCPQCGEGVANGK